MKFIKKHITAIIVIFICLLLMIFAAFAVYRMFYPSNNKSVYGKRLDEAPEIKNELISEIKNEISEFESVNSISYSKVAVTMKFFVDVKENVKIADAKKIGDSILSKLDSAITGFYDVEIYLTQKEGEFEEYPAIGHHSKSSEQISWVLNKDGESNEK